MKNNSKKEQKRYTVKEWKKFYKIQEEMCKKYDVILTDYKTRKQKINYILEKINLKNTNKGINTFNKIIQDFGNSMDKLTTELNKTSKNNIKIWSDVLEDDSQKSKNESSLEKIWGRKNEV